MTVTEFAQILLRSATAAAWTAANPVPGAGEPCFESDTNKLKIGDGVTAWTSLAYFAPSSGGTTTTSALLAVATATASAAYTTTSTTSVAMDATNLSVTFTAPASGNVVITQSAYAATNSTTIGAYEWSLITTAGVDVAACSVVSKQTSLARRIATYYVTGLTPGTSYTYRWGHRQAGGITGTSYTGGNAGTSGNAIMTVEAA